MIEIFNQKFIAATRLLRDRGLLYLVKYTLQVIFQYPTDLVAYLRVSIAERLSLGTISELLISGTPVAVNECNPSRKQSMADVVALFQQPILALEIGTWFGKGSTQIWIKSLPKGSSLVLMDSWRPYLSASDKKNSAIAKF